MPQSRACGVTSEPATRSSTGSADPAVLAPLALLTGIYVWRFRAARREAGGRGAGVAQAAAFTAGMLALLAALVSPARRPRRGLPLLGPHGPARAAGRHRPAAAAALALARDHAPRHQAARGVERALGPLASPWTGLVLWIGIMYLWHIPALYDVAVEHPLRAPARARVVLHRGRGALVAARPAGADAQAPDRHAAARLHRLGQGGPGGPGTPAHLEAPPRSTRTTSRPRGSGTSRPWTTRTWAG